ncbi:conserved hypothetical protein [Perkinsus marinus ATCC 50983]|uniref:Phosphoribulokinase/uridine kinase domain-containing protein n=1 Tax=Perkinsus marinus (strain ATCC 50983 / TXsc) TaxID=423536 RepID=C5M014_PERM5|nr:conserved hypothetical protein [Perkinsus marinus ATCC 50983]EEQ97672.1 conserved hypothetical protein [Perkinsus marinus ATCC 50983]|eukprot:XP_002764955.1 conserved hypothetical protein [Perkinsus marinus ATCC 50983]
MISRSTSLQVLQSLITTNTSRRCIGISLDDFYLSAEGRARKANATGIEALSIRGPPGTHQTQRLLKVLARLHGSSSCNHELVLPRFDKALDTTVEDETFPALRPGDIFLLEGWCVAAPPPPTDESTAALNSLDADLRFREFVDEELRGDYSEIWSQLDVHVHLQVPSWTCVLRWRQDQEDELRRKVGGDGIDVKEFCRGYERITRRMLKSCPDEADAVIFLGEDHSIAGCKIRN